MWSAKEIFIKELDKALNEGHGYQAATKIAEKRADEIFWDLVDQARTKAKDER